MRKTGWGYLLMAHSRRQEFLPLAPLCVESEKPLNEFFVCTEIREREATERGLKIDQALLCSVRKHA